MYLQLQYFIIFFNIFLHVNYHVRLQKKKNREIYFSNENI